MANTLKCGLCVAKAHHEIWGNYKYISVICSGLSRSIIKTSGECILLLTTSDCQLLLQKLLNVLNNNYFRNTTKDCDCSHTVFTNLLYLRLTNYHVYSPHLVLSCVLCQFAAEMGAYSNIFIDICLFWSFDLRWFWLLNICSNKTDCNSVLCH